VAVQPLLDAELADQIVDADFHRLFHHAIDLYPGQRNEKFTLDRPITDEKINGNYNNFYEFNSSKQVAKQAQAL